MLKHKISKCVKDLCEDVLRLHLQRIMLDNFGYDNVIYNQEFDCYFVMDLGSCKKLIKSLFNYSEYKNDINKLGEMFL